MDQQRRSAQPDSGKPYKKGRGRFVSRGRSDTPISDSTAAEDLAEYIIAVLANDPDAVQITRKSYAPGRTKLSISCVPAVTGRLIGKDGKTITALRQLIRAVAAKYGKRIDIDVAMSDD